MKISNLPQVEENQEVFDWNRQYKEIEVAHYIGWYNLECEPDKIQI